MCVAITLLRVPNRLVTLLTKILKNDGEPKLIPEFKEAGLWLRRSDWGLLAPIRRMVAIFSIDRIILQRSYD